MIKIYEDGDQWCALLGPDVQSGISAHASTPREALQALVNGMECEFPDGGVEAVRRAAAAERAVLGL